MTNVLSLAFVGVIPIGVAFVLLAGLRWSAARAMGVGWLLAGGIGLTYWGMEIDWLAASAVYGAFQAVDIILIVFGAILLMNYLEGSGAIATIRWYFGQIEEDRRIQVLLIGLGFMTIIEGAAGFGTPGALAAPLFIGLGFPPLAAAVFGLFFNAPNPPFGAAGTPVIGGTGAVIDPALSGSMGVSEFLSMVSAWSGIVTGVTYVFWGLLGVFFLTYWFGDADGGRSVGGAVRDTLPIAPFALLLGVVTGGTQLVVAWFVGPALPDIAAGFVVLGVGLLLANNNILIPDREWDFPTDSQWSDTWLGGLELDEISRDQPQKEMSVLLAWTPYLLVALALLATRWPDLTVAGTAVLPWIQSFTVGIDSILGTELGYTLQYLYLPGTMPFIPIAVLTGLIHKMDVDEMGAAWRRSAEQVAPAALTLIIAVSMTQVMIQSQTNTAGLLGMMEALSRALAIGAGGLLPMISPWIGAIGSFMTGSNTSSNILFSVLQYNAAETVELSRTIAVSLQNVGGGLGNMVSVLNVAAICGVVGITGREGDLLRKAIVPMALFALFAGLFGMLLSYVLVPGLF
ncbi:L-lactate permease [Halorubrum ezzemoulense]|uniref:Lactate permease n=1 Tax=Halorubrum ezzemoulense TaxID=337243 RepID=A0A256JTQ9_HALEZ|nr:MULTISPECIES: L-lactate permease [Halorubrum]MDB2241290.1 L-lactate permease [Halorubrum ezzemoulense]MDB2244993.1 L-lactate permease [Halorubrum ezzemoulense]MDB2251200.1 L-lactate permease [Halorubrum ezzemoulense]MDB2259482.1 L-lactate permease [Halorubrum ezzemoulense]MDB2263505.1 L-lactate permease [Halorubrum ezzemoulense]